MRFIHTADWQIGKSFRRYGERELLLKQARLETIGRIGDLAMRENAAHVLVAGDVYDHFAPSDRTAAEPMERMRRFTGVTWHLIPGNHDPHRPDAVWDRLMRKGLPPNVRAHLSPAPVELEAGVVLLPAPLLRNSETNDLTAWMDHAATPTGALRIGLAHGAVTGFGDAQEAGNPVDPSRPKSAGLAYLALGDWHRTMKIGERVWYAGTPEPDRVGSQSMGQVLLVDVASNDAPPLVTPLESGQYRWETREVRLNEAGDLADFETGLRAMPETFRTLLRLTLAGALPLAARADLQRRLGELEAAFFHMDASLEHLTASPSADDLDAIDFDGVLRKSAELLRARSADPDLSAGERRIAADAMVELFLLATRTKGQAA